MGRLINAVICGFIIAVVLYFFLPSIASFLAYFIASIIAIYFFGIKEVEGGILVAFAIYVFTEWVLGSIALVGFLLSNENISFVVDEWMVLSQILTTLFVLLGGMAGTELARRKRQVATPFPPSPIPVPPPSTLPVPPSSVPVAPSGGKKFCRFCGGENKTDAIFCEKCGKRIG